MKLAYLINQYPQPSQSFIRREIRALEQLGVEIVRFTVRRYTGELIDPADRDEQAKTTAVLEVGGLTLLKDALTAVFAAPRRFWGALRMAWRHGKTNGRGRSIQLVYLAEAATLKRMLKEAGVTHVHAHFGTNSAEVALLCRLLGGPPYSFTAHGPEEFEKALLLHLDDKTHHAAFVVCISSFGRSQLWRRTALADWPKARVVHCGVDEHFLTDQTPPPVPENGNFVCIGRLVEQKGQLVLLEAARLLRDRGERFCIHLLGDGPVRGELERFIQESDLGEQVKLHGLADTQTVRRQILEARAMVLPSFAEGLPVVLMESLALARPCIATYVAGIPELVRPGREGWLVPAGDAEALADAMAQVLATPTDRLTEMGRAGAERIRQRHDIRREAGKLRDLLVEAAQNGR